MSLTHKAHCDYKQLRKKNIEMKSEEQMPHDQS